MLSILTMLGPAPWADCSTACPACTAARPGHSGWCAWHQHGTPACLGPERCRERQGPAQSAGCGTGASRVWVRRGCGSGRARKHRPSPQLPWLLRRGRGNAGILQLPPRAAGGQWAAHSPRGKLSPKPVPGCAPTLQPSRVFIGTRGTSDVCEVLCVEVFTRSGCCSGNAFEVFAAL